MADIVRSRRRCAKSRNGCVPRDKLLGSRAVENLRLHLNGRDGGDWPLRGGVHRIVREANGAIGFGDEARGALLAQLCLDRRGLWLQVANGVRGIHVNGRSVRRVAALRAGDALHLDGVEVLVQGRPGDAAPLPEDAAETTGDTRMLLRGVGGPYHGRSVPLDRPRLVGYGREADIRADHEAVSERHARLERHGERVLLRDLGSEAGSLVNGHRVRDAVLLPGDQVVFGQCRFVVEAPFVSLPEPPPAAPVRAAPEPVALPEPSTSRWPWLLLAAMLLAVALGALLLFGAG